MSIFSCTAPFISDEQEMEERASLTESELQAIHNDLYGIRVERSHVNVCDENNNINNNHNNKNNKNNIMMDTYCINGLHSSCGDCSVPMEGSINVDVSTTSSSTSSSSQSYQQHQQQQQQQQQSSLAYQLIQDALEQMPSELNEAYRVAIEKNPSLVRTDNNWDYFITTYQSNIWTIAEKIASYWSIRRTVFGTDRYYLPMTIEGAVLNIRPEFEKQVFRITGRDDHGRSILFVDRIRLASIHRDIAMQLFFYWIHQLTLQKQSPNNRSISNVFKDGTSKTTSVDQCSSYAYVMIVNVKVRSFHKEF
jgi:hypothetical protein